MFNTTNYFEIKCYAWQQPFSCPCHALLTKSKFMRSLTYYYKSKHLSTTTKTNTTAAVILDQEANVQMTNAHDQLNFTLNIIKETSIHMSVTTRRPMTIQFHLYKSTCSKCQHRNHWLVWCQSRTPSTGRWDPDSQLQRGKHIYNYCKGIKKIMTESGNCLLCHLPWHLGPWQWQRGPVCNTSILIKHCSAQHTSSKTNTIQHMDHMWTSHLF